MRKILGSFGMTARPSHRFVPLFLFLLLPLSTTLCRAESCEPGGSFPVETITSINYPVMFPGNTYYLKIKGSFPYDIPTYPGCNLNEDYVIEGYGTANEQAYPDVSFVLESGSLFYSQGTFTETEIDITIIIGPDAPLGTAELVLTGDGDDYATTTFQIGNCPTPTITSVKPGMWFAGKSYDNVKVIGTGFTTTDESKKTGCPVTPVTITGEDGGAVPISGVTVDSKTHITLSGVAPPAADPTEAATVTAGTAPKAGTFGTAQILGNQITCGIDTMRCTQPVISTTDGSDPPIQGGTESPINVGEPMFLIANPDLPATITPTKTIWTVGGTRIAGYTPTPDSASVTELKDTDLQKSSVSFYWAYPEKDIIPVTYKYCVAIPGADADGRCSPEAKAAFQVTGGGAMTNQPYKKLTIDELIPCVNGHKPTGSGPFPTKPTLVYGNIIGYNCSAVTPGSTYGITFTPSGGPSGGTFSYAQIIDKNEAWATEGNKKTGCDFTQGLDQFYPYQGFIPGTTPLQAQDDPGVILTQGTEETRTFKATMFLMWTSNVANSITVPIGYQTWGFKGSAKQGFLNIWKAKTEGTPGPVGDFVPSDGSQTSDGDTPLELGFPIWSGPSECN